MKLGIFGGTFNPIHYGHLINAQIIGEEFGLDKVLFMPSRYPVHKKMTCEISADDRYVMIRLAIEGIDLFDVSRIEIDRNEPSYTIITIKQLDEIFPDSDFYLIIGSDSFNEIHTWKDYRELVRRVSLIVMTRKEKTEYTGDILQSAKCVLFAGNPVIEISSSGIRERIGKGLTVRNFVPPAVEKYILTKGLYRN